MLCCRPIGENCGTLIYDPLCPACSVMASCVRLADIKRTITLTPVAHAPEPLFVRRWRGRETTYREPELQGQVAAELLGVTTLPLVHDLVQWLLYWPSRWLRLLVVWAHGAPIRPRRA